MCRLIGLLVALAFSLVVGLLVAAAPATRGRIAFLGLPHAPPASALPPMVAAFHQGLHKLGWVEGQNLTIEWRWADGSLERFAILVDEVVRLPVEVMVVPNAATAEIAQRVTTTMPIVVMGGGSLAQNVGSLAQPGGNITGVAVLGPEMAPKRLEPLAHAAHAIPGLTRVAVLRGLASQRLELQAMEVGARALGVQLQLLEVRDPAAMAQAVAAASRERAGALVVFGDGGSFLPLRTHLAELAVTHWLASIFGDRTFVEAGGLMSYGPSLSERGQRVATFVDKILKGAKPGDLPVEQPTKFDFVINLTAAQALGLTIPLSLFSQATEVIQSGLEMSDIPSLCRINRLPPWSRSADSLAPAMLSLKLISTSCLGVRQVRRGRVRGDVA